MTDLFWFSDEQWARIEPLLPKKNTRGLKRNPGGVDDRDRVAAAQRTRLPAVLHREEEARSDAPLVPQR